MERLSRAFLFHEALSTEDEGASVEEAVEHVLWYFPDEAPLDERLKNVGLAQALLSFGDRFTRRHAEGEAGERAAREPCADRVELVRTRSHCHGFLECEPRLWFVLVVRKIQPTWTRTELLQRGGPHVVGGGKFEGESRVRLRSRLQTVVFGRGVGPGATNEGGRKGLENRNGFSSGGGSSAAAVDSGGVSISLKGGSGSGGDGGVAEDWVDETVLRAAMAKAYDTFALLHGPLQAALDAPVTLSRGVSGKGEDDGSGGGQSVVLPGVEILRRLATAQKRLRVVRTTAGLARPRREQSVEELQGGGAETAGAPEMARVPIEEGEYRPRSQSEVSDGERLRAEEAEISEEIAALRGVSPLNAIRETLSDFFASYLPGAGLSQPHLHLDLGYPQSLPMDSYRRELGQRMRRRVRQRLRSELADDGRGGGGGDENHAFDVDIVVTLAGGALLLACMDPPAPALMSPVAEDHATSASFDDDDDDGSGSSPLVVNGGGMLSDTTTRRSERDGAVLGGREAHLLVGYLCAVAGTAEAVLEAEMEARADGDTSRSSSGQSERQGEGDRYKFGPGPFDAEENLDGSPAPAAERAAVSPGGGPKALWAKFKSGFLQDENNNQDDGSLSQAGGGRRTGGRDGGRGGSDGSRLGRMRSEFETSEARAGGLLCCDGSLLACDGSVSAEDLLAGGTRVWAPRLHDLLGGGGLREEYPPRVPPASFITKRDQDRDEGQDASPLERFPKIRTDEAEAGEGGADSTSASSFSAGAPPRTRVVAYLRRDLCALVAFREGGEREQRCACAERGNVGEVAFARDGSNGGSGTSGRRPSGARRSCYACSRENWGWSDAEVLTLGSAIETSLSEDPDLSMLEDDVNDLCGNQDADGSSTVGASGNSEKSGGSKVGGGEGGGGDGGRGKVHSFRLKKLRKSRQKKPSKSGKAILALRQESSSLPTFSASGLFCCSEEEALSRARLAMTQRPSAAACILPSAHDSFPRISLSDGSDSDASPRPPGEGNATTRFSSNGCGGIVDEGSQRGFDSDGVAGCRTTRVGSCGREKSSSTGHFLLVGAGEEPLGGESSRGRFYALLKAFEQRARACGGVAGMRRGDPGRAHELAVLDDIHASVRTPLSIERLPFAFSSSSCVGEIGVRTSMSTGNRWVIGRRIGGSTASAASKGGAEEIDGDETYATLEAPILSVGDARAAADSMF